MTAVSAARVLEMIAGSDAGGVVGGEARIVKPLAGGGGAATFEVEGPKGSFIVRVVEPGLGLERLKKEQRLGEFLSFLPVKVPRIAIHEAPGGGILGIYRKIDGESFSGEMFNDLFSKRDREVFVGDVAELLNRLHAVSMAEGCRALGISAMTKQEAAREFRFGGWFDAVAIERALTADLGRDARLKDVWDDTREWFESYETDPDDMVFGHGDLHGGNMAIASTPDGYRLAGVFDLQIGGIVNLYDEFLRIRLMDDVVGRRIVEAYNRMPGRARPVDAGTLGHAFRAFGFYLAHENSGESRQHLTAMVKRDLL